MARLYNVQTLSILAGQSVSNGLDMNGWKLHSWMNPAAWTAATGTQQGSADGITYGNIKLGFSGGAMAGSMNSSFLPNDMLIQDAGGQYETISPRYFRFESGTDAAPIVQTAQRDFQVI